MSAQKAINVRNKISDVQSKLSHAAKSACGGLDRRFVVSWGRADGEKRAKDKGVNPGGLIMIHGQKNGYGWLGFITQPFNWTDGCIAVKNSEMDEIWESVNLGTPIIIEP